MRKCLIRKFNIAMLLCSSLLIAFSNFSKASEVDSEAYVVTRESAVTKEMVTSDFWKERVSDDVNNVMLTKEQVVELNEKILKCRETYMYDLINMPEKFDALSKRKALAKAEIPTRDLFINGKKIDNKEYFSKLIRAIKNTGYSSNSKDVIYAVCVKQANLKTWPTNDIIGYSFDDSDDEYQSANINVNEPFVIKAKCKVDNKIFYWGESIFCTGWIDGDNLAICNNKEEWLDAWKVDVQGNDFLVVNQDKLVVEPLLMSPEISNVSLTLGTILKLVPNDEIPKLIGERGRWHNYVVYLPIRNEFGKYEKKMALIAERNSISQGFLPLSESNILDVAFSCLGSRYGWGGMLDATDCSLYVRDIYRCFGFEFPRNTVWQQKIPYKYVDLSKLNDEEKKEILSIIPVGSSLYMPGHTMIYIGKDNDLEYVISACGSLSDSMYEVPNVEIQNSIIINPLTVKRANGTTWLSNLTGALCLSNCVDSVKEKVTEMIEQKNNNTNVDIDNN